MEQNVLPPAERPLMPAIVAGLKGRCPECGHGRIFDRFLVNKDRCGYCALDLTGHEAHDFPAYIVILLLGHIIVSVMISVNAALSIPVVWQMAIWPTLTVVLAILLIQPVKGGVIAYQWARRMHGFAEGKG